jgi:hypothetical protein
MNPDDSSLAEHIADHLCEEQPEAVAGLSDAEIRRRAEICVAAARRHGFTLPEPITAFASLMFLVSPRFDEQPAIARALADRSLPERERLTTLFQRTKESDWDAAGRLGQVWPG